MSDDLRRVRTWAGATRQIRLQIRNSDGTAKDLSAFDSATVSADLGGTAKITAETVTIEGGTSGWVNFTPAAGEIDVAGDYRAQIRFVDGTDVDYTDQFIIEVGDPIYNT